MKRFFSAATIALSVAAFSGCKKDQAPTPAPAAQAPAPVSITPEMMAAMANAVPSTGPKEGNNYKVFFLVLRQNQAPAVGFKVDMTVKGKGETVTKTTNEQGLAQFDALPFPDSKHQLVGVLHYFKGKEDQPREMDYPFIEGDAYRLKDTQYIPNTVTPDAQP